MAEFIKHDFPADWEATIICTSDWHVGAKAHHEKGADDLIARVHDEPDTYLLWNGDGVEGKKIDSPHFDLTTLDRKKARIQEQYHYLRDKLKPIAHKILCIGKGNHDIYLSKDLDWVEEMCTALNVPMGGYQTWVEITPHLRVFMYHGRRSMPKGAKDPIQRKANRMAWLKRELESLAGDCHVMLMGHTHYLLSVPPIEQYTLLSDPDGDNVKAAFFREAQSSVQTNHGEMQYVPKEARWYGNTGTFRRSGGFGYVDYAEIGGYAPSPIGYLEMVVRDGRCVNLMEIVV